MFGLAARTAIGGDKGGGHLCIEQQFTIAADPLMNIATCRANRLDGAGDNQRIVEMRGLFIFERDLRDGVCTFARLMHGALIDPDAREHVGPRPFHEMQVTRVIDDAGKIGVLKIDADGEQMFVADELAVIGLGLAHRSCA